MAQKKVAQTVDYKAASQELNAVMEALQNPDIEVDDAVKLYEKGQTLLDNLEAYLKTAENTIRKHTAD